MRQDGRLEAIWVKRVKRGPMDRLERAQLAAGWGIVGNANTGGRRQVTVIEKEVWDEITRRLGADLDPATRRANLMISGCRLAESRGRILRIGPCRIRILGETRPCNIMEDALPGLEEALREPWNGGAFGEVLEDGEIAVGDPVAWVEELTQSRGDAQERVLPAR